MLQYSQGLITASSDITSITYVKTPYMMSVNPAIGRATVPTTAMMNKINHSAVLTEEDVTSNAGFRFCRENMTISVTMRAKLTVAHAIKRVALALARVISHGASTSRFEKNRYIRAASDEECSSAMIA